METLYEKDKMPPDLFRELGKLGVNGIVFEEEYGGAGPGYVEALIVHENIARVSNALAMTACSSQILCFDNFRRNATEGRKRGLTVFLPFSFTPKVRKVVSCQKIKKWGMRTSPTGLITFDNMELSEENLIGGLNRGVVALTNGLCTERISLSACSIGS